MFLKKFVRVKILFLSLVASVLVFSMYASAVPTLVAVTAPNILQSKSNWCWAASSDSLLSGKGIAVTQFTFSVAAKGNSTNNNTATSKEVRTGAIALGYNATISGSQNDGTVHSYLYNKKGIIAGYLYTSGGGHMVVISGHDSGDNTLEIMNPSVGRKEYYDFSYFSSNSNWNWVESVY